MAEETQEKLPLDAKLLADAVMELNISRRSVGLYPADHPLVRESIGRAYEHLVKLFEIRFAITLGIAKDALVVDEYTLDKKNPVFREFARALHERGIAAVTFSSGLTREELLIFHEFLTKHEELTGKSFEESLRGREVIHVSIRPLDFTSFGFAKGVQRKGEGSGTVWEDYIYGLLEGSLGTGDSQIIQSVPPEEMAGMINTLMTEESSDEAYDRVITTYMRKKEGSRISRESFEKLFSFIDRLRPELKRQFLTRSCTQLAGDIADVETIIREMNPETFERTISLISENASLIPTTMKNLLDKLSAIKQTPACSFDFTTAHGAILDDIEIGTEIKHLFAEDHFRSYVSEAYERDLAQMLKSVGTGGGSSPFNADCTDEKMDETVLDILLELIDTAGIRTEDYLALITKLSEMMPLFADTGRFEEILQAYNTVNSHVLGGKFSQEASGIVDYFFHSQSFIERIMQAFRLWGRRDRDSAIRLARGLRRSFIDPLLDALAEEPDSGMRRFFLTVLSAIGTDVIPHAVKRLHDERWHVLRNMIYLIRECKGAENSAAEIRRFLKHGHPSVVVEALRSILEFGTADAVPHLKAFLNNDEEEIRRGAVRLAGRYRVGDAVEPLLALLERKDLLGRDSHFKIEIVRALGEISDPRAVPTLSRIVHARTLFYRGDFSALKLEIFRSLENYPAEAVQALIRPGREAGQEEIRAISERIAAKLGIRGRQS